MKKTILFSGKTGLFFSSDATQHTQYLTITEKCDIIERCKSSIQAEGDGENESRNYGKDNMCEERHGERKP